MFPSVAGTKPNNELSLRFRKDMPDQFPREVGIGPVRKFSARCKYGANIN
jgi:hypothetical protein